MNKEVKEPIAEYGKLFTYADYLSWTIEERFEILKGKLFKMTPAPNRDHQRVSGLITHQLHRFFGFEGSCEVYVAPFDIRLPDQTKNSVRDEDVTTVFQPDLCVICDSEKLDKKGCIGAPDLIVEILSPGNSNREMKNKYEIYEEAGVREYWMVNPENKTILLYVLENGVFIGKKPFIEEEEFVSVIFPDLRFEVADIFPKS